MTFVQIRDIVSQSYRDYLKVSEFYEELLDAVDDEQVKFMIANMRSHMLEAAKCLRVYASEKNAVALNTWLQYSPEMADMHEILRYDYEMSDDDILQLAESIHQGFTEYFEKLADCHISAKATDIFEDLRKISCHDSEREAWQKVMLADL